MPQTITYTAQAFWEGTTLKRVSVRRNGYYLASVQWYYGGWRIMTQMPMRSLSKRDRRKDQGYRTPVEAANSRWGAEIGKIVLAAISTQNAAS